MKRGLTLAVWLASLVDVSYAINLYRHTWFMEGVRLTSEMLDPIVSPNGQASHMHQIFGGSGFSAAYNHDDYENAQCTSLEIGVDKSNYWIPQMYWVEGGVHKPTAYVPLQGHPRLYYDNMRNSPEEPVKAFPKGLRILHGNPSLRTEPDYGSKLHICQVNADFTENRASNDFNFNRDCPGGIKAQLIFPSCWDGENLYKQDGSHVKFSFPNQPCPVSHPIRVPQIRFEVTWYPNKLYPGKSMAGQLAYANGDTIGYGFHADFVNGWDVDVLQAALEDPRCIANTLPDPTRFRECPLFATSFQDAQYRNRCRPDKGELKDQHGNVDSVRRPNLPGCNPLWFGTGPKPTCSPAVASMDVTRFKGTDGSLTAAPSDRLERKLPTVPGWQQTGCTSIDTPLVNQVKYDGKMTLADCTETCLRGGKPWAAFSVGWDRKINMCLCGSDLSPTTPSAGECTTPCPGDASKTCGSSTRFSIFYAPPSTPIPREGMPGMGCYGEPWSWAAGIRGKTLWSFKANQNTGVKCAQACKSHNASYTWAATRYKNECYCGADTNLGAGYWRPDSWCSWPCAGNSTEMCGSDSSMNVYNLSSTDVRAIDTAASKFGGYKGCFKEPRDGHLLNGNKWTDNAMSPSGCVNGCSEMGFTLAGVMNGNMCLCGNNATSAISLPALSCDKTCWGDKQNTCGADRIFELFETSGATRTVASVAASKPPGWTGCFYTPSKAEGLTQYAFDSGGMSVDLCLTECRVKGYTFAGPRSGNRCTCSNAKITSRQVVNGWCNKPCRGNGKQTCGSDFYTEVYSLAANAGTPAYTSNSSTPSTPPTSTAPTAINSMAVLTTTPPAVNSTSASPTTTSLGNSTVKTTASPSAADSALVPDPSNVSNSIVNYTAGADSSASAPALNGQQEHLGCMSDISALNVNLYSSSFMSGALCSSACGRAGYAYAGTQLDKCRCGNVRPNKVASKCDAQCPGNGNTETCGSSNSVDAYQTGPTDVVVGQPRTLDGVKGYLGCYGAGKHYTVVQASGSTVFASDRGMDPEMCARNCAGLNYNYAAVFQGKRCTCGDTINLDNAGAFRVREDSCNFKCTGNQGRICGSQYFMSVYDVRSSGISQVRPEGSIGCFEAGPTFTSNPTTYKTSMTQGLCRRNCRERGYTYAAVTMSNVCSCTNDETWTEARPLDHCSTPCSGDSKEMCGTGYMSAGNFLEASGPASFAPAGFPTDYVGCYAAQDIPALVTHKVTANGMTPDSCSKLCQGSGGSGLTGIYNGNACHCLSKLPVKMVMDSNCNTACSGAPKEPCGGGTAYISLYRRSIGAVARQEPVIRAISSAESPVAWITPVSSDLPTPQQARAANPIAAGLTVRMAVAGPSRLPIQLPE